MTCRSVRFTILRSIVAAAASACQASGGDIVIGLAAPLSEARGASMRAGAELAVAEINQAGGVRGRHLVLVAEDDSARTDVAVRVANGFVNRRDVVAVVGHLTSSATAAAAPVYNGGNRPLVHVSPSASSPSLSGVGPYSFRVCPDDEAHGRRLARWVRETMGAEWVAILFENDDYGRGVRTAFSESFASRGGYTATEDPFNADLPTFEPFLMRLQEAGGAAALLVAGSAGGAARVLASLDSLNMPIQVIGADGLTGIEADQTVNTEGLIISSAYLPDRSDPRNDAFVSAFRASSWNRQPDHRAAGAYDAVHLIARAIDAVGADRRRIRDYLASVGSGRPAYEGVTGTIAFDEAGDITRSRVWIGVVHNGQLLTAPGQ